LSALSPRAWGEGGPTGPGEGYGWPSSTGRTAGPPSPRCCGAKANLNVLVRYSEPFSSLVWGEAFKMIVLAVPPNLRPVHAGRRLVSERPLSSSMTFWPADMSAPGNMTSNRSRSRNGQNNKLRSQPKGHSLVRRTQGRSHANGGSLRTTFDLLRRCGITA